MRDLTPSLILFAPGFYGNKEAATAVVISPFDEARVAQLQYDARIFDKNPKSTIVINQEVNDLYVNYMVNSALFLRKFDNRELVMQQALRSFGSNFTDWYLKHARDQKIDENIINFIEDTCRFIQTGERKFPIMSWERMVQIKNGPNPYREVPTHISSLTHVFSHLHPAGQHRKTTDVVQRWLTQPGGIVDMLVSLKIMFGPIPAKL